MNVPIFKDIPPICPYFLGSQGWQVWNCKYQTKSFMKILHKSNPIILEMCKSSFIISLFVAFVSKCTN